jgi:hypothetical protein
MSRILWLLVFLLGAVLFVKPLRDRARPQIEFALNPIYSWEAKNRTNALARVLVREKAEGTPLPAPRDFQQFLSTHEGTDAAMDPWGQPYYLVRDRRMYRVGSSGPDRRPNTTDDIRSTASVEAPSTRRR